ncbi:MAG TPA: 2-oxoglutarate dehydrogenase E1 component [Candidatus Eisenbacteria bacterium]|nr:2-oxoglutarate dehydrogenase E1 component [Candidatus Eisenbacteria bacterium]
MSTVLMNTVETEKRERVMDSFRRWGYLQADLDPVGHFAPLAHPDLEITGEEADAARRIYCGSIGAEFMHIPDPERRRWVQEQLESEQPLPVNRERILDQLVRADIFEHTIHSRYIGTKRYSLEGNTALIPLLDEILDAAAENGAEQAVLAMSHRGRLNVIINVVSRPAAEIFAGFEDVDPRSVLGGGDVKYHIGATGIFTGASGGKLRIHLVSNPSHLEAVNPVAQGRARAKQTRIGRDGKLKVLPLIMHGDSAFAGQGITAETLNLANLRGYTVGGSVHVIVNNLIGFTSNPNEAYSSRFSSDLAKRLPIPIFHVNGEDPDAVVRVGRMALEYRYEFGSDVVVDLIGFRRHGHSEVDDPTITQPILYRKIKDRPLLYLSYAERVGLDPKPFVDRFQAELDAAQKAGKSMARKPVMRQLPSYWAPYHGGPHNPADEVDTGLPAAELQRITDALTKYPEDFHIHPKVLKLLEQRREMGYGKRSLDYGMAEALAFGSLALQGTPIRLSGQDSRRGTFNQRHSVLIDILDEKEYVPLCHLAPGQARVEIYNSELSEAAVLGFEYGFSRDFPETLVMWEAQFGDFANGAQIIIDQFVAAGEDKWDLLTGLVLLLPHGHEGQGPEHSSARIERYLQLCARDNMQVAQPSTAGQYFHLLRRQAMRKWRVPLIVFTPKSMLRHPEALSPIAELERPCFQTVLADESALDARRVLLCTGKIGHELRMERRNLKREGPAIVMLEQMYPFPEDDLRHTLVRYTNATEFIWVQEEPANMGALSFVVPRLKRIVGAKLRSIKRAANATPATGSAKAHELEQKTLIALALG